MQQKQVFYSCKLNVMPIFFETKTILLSYNLHFKV